MRLPVITAIILTIMPSTFCENFLKPLNASSVFLYDPNQEACYIAIRFDVDDCYQDYCSEINCFNNSKQVYCSRLWYSMCCVGYLAKKQCSIRDYIQLLNYFDGLQTTEESANCVQYPRSSMKCESEYLEGNLASSASVSNYLVISQYFTISSTKSSYLICIAVIYALSLIYLKNKL